MQVRSPDERSTVKTARAADDARDLPVSRCVSVRHLEKLNRRERESWHCDKSQDGAAVDFCLFLSKKKHIGSARAPAALL